MLLTEERRGVFVATEGLDRIRALYQAGYCLRAYEMARTFGPLRAWEGTKARVVAGWLVSQVGAPRVGMALWLRAWRDDRNDAVASFYAARTILARRGPLKAWEFIQRVGRLEDAADPERSNWLAAHASTLSRLRDFDAAESWLALAEKLARDRVWWLIERSDLSELEDRYEDALAAARESLALRPWNAPAVQAAARLLQALDHDDDAVELLEEAAGRIESSAVVAQLGALQAEMGRHVDARRSWDRFAELAPLIETQTERWLAGRRSDAAYGLGDIAAAAAFARESGGPFFLAVAERCEMAGDNARRVVLDVRFVRQHHQTCGPATLAAISGFWGKNTAHLEIADSICYDGTPDHRERSWAEQGGWVAREFTVNWESATALLDRGIPFTLTTVETQSAHLQAVIGYDARRGTLLIRDPSRPYFGEVLADTFLKRYRSVGPRGMALVPGERAELLQGIHLPDASLYDHLHRLQVALREYDRDRADQAHNNLRAAAPGHRLELIARQALAHYDADWAAMRLAAEDALDLFPDDANLRICQLGCMQVLGRREERLTLYRELCGRPNADHYLCRQYARS